DFQSEFKRLLHYLELTIPEEAQAVLEKELSFATLKKTNPNHLRKGGSGYWLDVLTAEQVARAETIAGPLMAFLQYGLDAPCFDKASATPELFADIKEDLIQNQKVLHYALPSISTFNCLSSYSSASL